MSGKKYFPNNWQKFKDAPDELFYQSGVDENVFGRIVVIDVPGDD